MFIPKQCYRRTCSIIPTEFCSFLVNLGGLLLQALLEYWPRTHINPMDEETEMNHSELLYAYTHTFTNSTMQTANIF